MIEIITAGIVLGVTLAFMVGPVFLLLIEISLTKGVGKAIVFDLGVLLADIIFIVLVGFGSTFIQQINNVSWVFAIGGILIIGYGIYNIYNAKRKRKNIDQQAHLPQITGSNALYLIKGFFLNFMNVGVLAYWLTTTVTLRAAIQGSANETALLWAYFTSTVAAYFATDLVKVFMAQRLKARLTTEVLIKIERTVGFILIVFGAFLILRGYLHTQGIAF